MRPINYITVSRYEHIADISYTANTALNLPTEGGNMPRDRYYWALLLTCRGRATMPATGGPTALIGPDGPYQLIERVIVEGYHVPRAQNERFIDLRGADTFRTGKLYLSQAMRELPATWSFTANATNDFEFSIVVPFVPLGISPIEQTGYLLDAPNYNPLKLTIQWGDAASMFGSGTAPTLTAFGSTTGSPLCRVAGIFAMGGGQRFAGRMMGKAWRYFQEVTGSTMTTTATGVRLLDLPKGHYIRGVVVKVGTKATTPSSGNNAYATFADNLTNIKIYRGLNTAIRWFPAMSELRNLHAFDHNVAIETGIAPLDFARTGVLAESLNARDLVAGPSGAVDFYAGADVTGATNGALTVIFEEIRQLPVVPPLPQARGGRAFIGPPTGV